MKNKLIYLALTLVVIVGGCEDGKNDNPEPTQVFRLAEYSWTEDGIDDEKLTFTYNDANKVTGWANNTVGNGAFKTVVNYPNDNTVELLVYDSNDSTSLIEEKIIYTFTNGLVSTVQGYYSSGSQLFEDFKTNFQYDSDGNIIETIYYSFEDGVEEQLGKHVLSYDGNMLLENIYYNYDGINWVEVSKTIYEYENNILNNSIETYYYDGNWITSSKEEFVYDGSTIKQIKSFSYIDNNTWELDSNTDYSYDSNGNMTKAEEISTGGEFYTEYYTYEEKSGNLSIFSFDADFGYPNPIYSPKVTPAVIPYYR